MLLEREVKGYATIKFAISCCLFYLAFTSIYTFVSLWDEENEKLQKFTYFLLIIVSVAAILFLNAHIALKRFVMGVHRYNQVRQLDQSKYANDIQIRAPVFMATKSNIKRKNEQSHKIKKHHSMLPADLLDRQTRKHHEQQKNRKYTKSFSLQTPYSNSQSHPSYNSQSQKSRNQQLTALFSQYKNSIQQKNSTLQKEKKRIEKCKNIIGRIFQAQTNRQIDNIQDLISHIEMLFDVKVVEQKSQRGGKPRIMADVGRVYEEVLLDEVLGWKQEGGIWFGGYRFNSRAQQQPQYKTQQLNQIDRIITQLYQQDRLLNFNTIFPTHKSRLSTIQQLKHITRHYLQNRPLFTSDNPNEQYQIKQLIIWILSAHINKQIYNKLNQIKIFLEDSTCQLGRIVYVCWREKQVQAECLVHFNQVYERVRAEERAGRQEKAGRGGVQVDREVFVCAPGDDNIASLLSMYLEFVGRQFKGQLPAVKQIEFYVNQVI